MDAKTLAELYEMLDRCGDDKRTLKHLFAASGPIPEVHLVNIIANILDTQCKLVKLVMREFDK